MEQRLVTIATFDNVFEAELAKAMLEEMGMQVFLQNERMMSTYPSIASDMYYVELQVLEEQVEEASRILEETDDAAFTQDMLGKMDCLLEGHFSLTSGKHSDRYIEKIKILQNPQAASLLCKRIAQRLADIELDAIVGPAYGGIALAFDVARILSKDFLFTQRKDEAMTLRSGFDLSGIKRVAVVEDIVTTGSSVFEVIAFLKGKGIEVVVVASIVDRSGGKVDFGCRYESLLELDIPAWEPEDCELCKRGVPLVKPGSSDKKSAILIK